MVFSPDLPFSTKSTIQGTPSATQFEYSPYLWQNFHQIRHFCQNNVSVKSKLQHAPPPTGHLTFLKIIVQIAPNPGQNAVQMPHTRFHSGDQMPPPRGHFTGTKMTEGRRKRLQLSNKIFINITKTEQHCQRIYYEQKSRAMRRKSLLQGH